MGDYDDKSDYYKTDVMLWKKPVRPQAASLVGRRVSGSLAVIVS